ncbi:sensory transduction system regulatory protein [Photobacterium marinum]|uniref:diguanylate cyclase n=1 Tax=Photobacterium marinum TaxID=1056511 RepID=L8JHP6_9GAMM|nr:diguanylate cyclase [Photobacterium marinum]ELR66977.1 sensory transduction system regulatory protein [Photobacterium marinum]
MDVNLKLELSGLVDLLARQSNLERWCYQLLSVFSKELKLSYITLLVEKNHEPRVIASWLEDVFSYFSTALDLDDYNGVPVGMLQQARQAGQFVQTYADKPSQLFGVKADLRDKDWCRLLLPIKTHTENVGFLYAETKQPDYFEANLAHIERLLYQIAPDISARVLKQEVIDNYLSRRSVEAELEIRNYSINEYLALLRNLHEVTLSLSKAKNLDQLYRRAVELGRSHLGIDRMAIFLTDFEKNKMQGTYGTDPEGNLVPRGDFTSAIPDHPLVNEALSHRDHVVVRENAPLYFGLKQVGTGWNAMIAMWNGEECIGWLAADNLINQQMLTEHQRQILKLFGAALGQQIVIRRKHDELAMLNIELEERVMRRTRELEATNRALAEANQQLEQLSMQDDLTCVANRRFFDLSLNRYWQSAAKTGEPLSLIMIDVDYFKTFNDTYGHQEGDNCLRKIATSLDKLVKPYKKSIFSRYGGEEFACLLPGADAQMALNVAEKMLVCINRLDITNEAVGEGRVTISSGLHTITPISETTPEDLIEGADRALYQAKEWGRNQHHQWSEFTCEVS